MRSRNASFAAGGFAPRFAAEGLVLLAMLGWWLTSASLPESVFPSPRKVLETLTASAMDPTFWEAAGISAVRIVSAVLIATLVGSAIGILPRYVRWTSGIVDDVLVPFFGSFPAIAWAILGTVWFGLTSTAILLVQFLIIMPFALVNASEGIKALGTEEVEMGKSFGRSGWAIFWRIELPLLRPFILAGARIAYGVCWKISLIAELFGGRSGLGYRMQLAQDAGEVDAIIAVCLAIVLFVVIGEWLIFRPLAKLFSTGNDAVAASTRTASRR